MNLVTYLKGLQLGNQTGNEGRPIVRKFGNGVLRGVIEGSSPVGKVENGMLERVKEERPPVV